MVLLLVAARQALDGLPRPDRLGDELDSATVGASPDYSLRFSPALERLSGHIAVRENTTPGTRLDLDRDIGLRTAAGADVRFEADAPSMRFQGDLEEMFGWGGHASRMPINWNGATFSTPSQIRDHASLLVVRPSLAFKALGPDPVQAWIGPLVGVEYPFMTVSFKTNLQKGSLEDWTHFLPYPVLGLSGHLQLAQSLSLDPRLTAGYLPNLPTPFIEGGRLYVSARPAVQIEIPLTWRLGPSLDVSFAATYRYWSGRDHSIEDGNTLTLSSPGILLGVGYHW